MPRNGERMVEFRIIINSIAYEKQEISDRLLKACVKNITTLTD